MKNEMEMKGHLEWTVIKQFITKPEAEIFMRNQETKINTMYYLRPLILVEFSDNLNGKPWLVITDKRENDKIRKQIKKRD